MKYKIPSWSGINNVFEADNPVFQGGDSAAYVTYADNVYLNNKGHFKIRPLFNRLASVTSGDNLFKGAGMVLVQDGSTIYSLDTDTGDLTSVVTGLSSTVSFCEHADQVFYNSSTDKGRIISDTNKPWGTAVTPTPTLTAVAGDLPAGRYLVSVAFIDSEDREYASDIAETITLNGSQDLQVSLSAIDSDAVYGRLYISEPNTPEMFYLGDVAVGSFPYTITELPSDATDGDQGQPWTIGLESPKLSSIFFSHKDQIIICSGKYFYPSLGPAVHLFDSGNDVFGVPEDIVDGESADERFFIVTAKDYYEVSNKETFNNDISMTTWQISKADSETEFCAGTYKIKSTRLPFLGLNPEKVAIFMSQYGPAFGTSGGMVFPFKDIYNIPITGETAKYTIHKQDGVDQLLICLSDRIIVINTLSGAITEYNLFWNGIVSVDNTIFGLYSTEILTEATSGETVSASIQTGMLEFGFDQIKYIDRIFVHCEPESTVDVWPFIYHNDEDYYLFAAKDAYRDGLDQQIRTFKTPAGIRSKYWGFKFENFFETKFDLQAVEFNVRNVEVKR